METVNGFLQRLKFFWEENKLMISLLLLVFTVFVIIVPDTTTPGKYDRRVWITWSNYMLSSGLSNVYKLGVDYLPLIQYVLYFYAEIQGSTEAIIFNINQLKYFNFFIELVGIFYCYLIVKSRYEEKQAVVIACMLILFNPAYLYNSILYGQWDGLYTTLSLMSFYYATKKNFSLCILFFLMALNAKIQAIIFFPIIFVVCLEHIVEKFDIKKISIAVAVGVVFQALILMPFYLAGDLDKVMQVALNMVGRYPLISMGANNFWNFFFENPHNHLDSGGFWGFSYNTYGLLMFITGMGIVFLPVAWWGYKKLFISKDLSGRFPVEKLILIGALAPVIFFFFNTQMHGRYAHATVLFGGIFALLTNRYLIYIILSTAYFLNMEVSAKIIKGNIVEYREFFMQPTFIASLFAIGLILGVVELFRKRQPSTNLDLILPLSKG
jgi:Gpi18-like mannosyltransferase